MKYVQSSYKGDTEELCIHPIGDLHIGSPHYNQDVLLRKLDKIDRNRANSRIILMGDLAETAIKDSVGAGVYEQRETALAQIRKAKNLLWDFRDLIDGVVTGNHEQRIYVRTGDDYTEEFCDLMDIKDKYLRYQGVVTYAWNKRAYTISVWHGSGGGSGSAINRLMKQRQVVVSDVYLMGHVHQRETAFRAIYIPDLYNHKIKKVTQAFIVTGSALEYEESYAEEKSLPPSVTGFPEIRLCGTTKHKKGTTRTKHIELIT